MRRLGLDEMERECGSRVQGPLSCVLFRFSRANCNIVPYKFFPNPDTLFPTTYSAPISNKSSTRVLTSLSLHSPPTPLKHLPFEPSKSAPLRLLGSVPSPSFTSSPSELPLLPFSAVGVRAHHTVRYCQCQVHGGVEHSTVQYVLMTTPRDTTAVALFTSGNWIADCGAFFHC